jgi:hypothetical protein
MQIVLGGKFESALVRAIDEEILPQRNRTRHDYYLGLNRHTDPSFLHRVGTFIVLAERTLVPQVDWNYPIDFPKYAKHISDRDLGVRSTDSGGREWHNDTQLFVSLLLQRRAFSHDSLAYMGELRTAHLAKEDRNSVEKNLDGLQEKITAHYLNRLMLHIRAAAESSAFLVLSEHEISILEEIGAFLSASKLPTPYDFPDLSGRVIDPGAFCLGLLNFAPPDVLSLAALREDGQIAKYAEKLVSVLTTPTGLAEEQAAKNALLDARNKSEAARKAENVFEVASWVVKPLHYVPVISNVVGIAEDVKDVLQVWVERKREAHDWYMLGARMTEVAIEEFLARKGNI